MYRLSYNDVAYCLISCYFCVYVGVFYNVVLWFCCYINASLLGGVLYCGFNNCFV